MGRQLNQYLTVLCGKYNFSKIIHFQSLNFPISISFSFNCCIANLCTFAFSISIGWMGIALVLYDSDDCPLPSGRVQLDELGWIASILGIYFNWKFLPLIRFELINATTKKCNFRYRWLSWYYCWWMDSRSIWTKAFITCYGSSANRKYFT